VRLREPRVTDSPPSHLTFELREALRHEVDRRRRAKLAEADRQEADRLLALFADERGGGRMIVLPKAPRPVRRRALPRQGQN
jgi:hypothetical protein